MESLPPMRTTWLLGCLLIAACGGGGSDGGGDGAPGVDAVTTDAPTGASDLDQLRALIDELPSTDCAAVRGRVDAFVRQIAYGAHGWPLHEDDTLGVIAFGAATHTIAGDFNGWASVAMTAVASCDVGVQVAIVEDVPVAEPAGYKIDDVADPLARRYLYDAHGELSLADATGAHLERWPAFDGGTLEARTVRVLVPASPTTELAVLYAHDGQNLFDPDAFGGGWHAQDAAAGAAPALIVGVDNTPARMDEYTQVQDSIGGGPVGGRADEYLALLDAVRTHIEARYPAATGPANTAIMGSSLGGLVSLYAAQQRPEVYGTAISLSGTVGWGTLGASNPTIGDLIAAAPPSGVTIYLDSGGAAPDGCELRDDTDNFCDNVALADRLRGLGWVDEDTLYYRHTPGAAHNEAAWAARLPGILTTVFPGR